MYLYVGGNLGIGMMIIIKIIIITILLLCRSFFFLKAATQLARQLHQERTQVVCSNKVTRKAWLAGTPTMDHGLKVKGKQSSHTKEE